MLLEAHQRQVRITANVRRGRRMILSPGLLLEKIAFERRIWEHHCPVQKDMQIGIF